MKPIIDVHAHIFNARDIPLKGYLLSRDYKKVIKILLHIPISFVARCIRRKLNPKKRGFLYNALCKLTLNCIYLFMGKQYRLWANTLSKRVREITSEMITTYQKDKIDLYVPLVIDYEYWFKNTPDNFMRWQLCYIYDPIILAHKGLIHPFVPFDPARELAFRKGLRNPDGEPEEEGSLKLVKDAIEKKGYIGVKLYNSLGYKPFNNAAVDGKRRKIALHRKKYVFNGEEYDEVLSELYDYCVENGVPITTHCVMGGIESYPGASYDFGQAEFWSDVLSQDRFKNLHLNLAHFGWNKKLDQGYGATQNWAKKICEMFAEYDYLFADVSCHRVVLEKESKKFKSDYKEMIREHPIVKKRLLFGIDWHVIKRVKNFSNFKARYVDVLQDGNLFTDEEVEDFLGGNALRFLGLLPGEKNRERLAKFYADHNIEPPGWYKATA